jgi:hypothetical protein
MTDILELGDDGSFEIPSIVSRKIDIDGDFKNLEEDEGEITANCNVASFGRSFNDLVADIAPGNYKVLVSSISNLITVIIMLRESEQVASCKIQGKVVEVSTNSNRLYSVVLPIAFLPQTATSSTFGQFFYVQMKKVQ